MDTTLSLTLAIILPPLLIIQFAVFYATLKLRERIKVEQSILKQKSYVIKNHKKLFIIHPERK